MGQGLLAEAQPTRPRLVWEPCSRAGKGSRLAELLRNERIRTNSFHHQAVGNRQTVLEVTARCDDGVVEGIESRLIPLRWCAMAS